MPKRISDFKSPEKTLKEFIAKQKAEELIGKCKLAIWNQVPPLQSEMFSQCIERAAKQCALICVEEILKSRKFWLDKNAYAIEETQEFWQEVKSSLESKD